MENSDAVKALITVMQSSSYPPEVRVSAAEGLGYTGFTVAKDALDTVMKSSAYPPVVRAAAAKALGRAVGVAMGKLQGPK